MLIFHVNEINRYKSVFLFLIALLVSGCASHKFFTDTSSWPLDEEYGLVILSFTQSGLEAIPFELYYRGRDNESKKLNGHLRIGTGKQWQRKQRDVDGKTISYDGDLAVFSLPPGQYEFSGLYIEDDYQQATWTNGGGFQIVFNVKPGQLNYLGNIHINTDVVGNHLLTVMTQLQIQDESERDKVALHQNYPQIPLTVSFTPPIATNNSTTPRIYYGSERSVRGFFF